MNKPQIKTSKEFLNKLDTKLLLKEEKAIEALKLRLFTIQSTL